MPSCRFERVNMCKACSTVARLVLVPALRIASRINLSSISTLDFIHNLDCRLTFRIIAIASAGLLKKKRPAELIRRAFLNSLAMNLRELRLSLGEDDG
jgi:hypothetical protein